VTIANTNPAQQALQRSYRFRPGLGLVVIVVVFTLGGLFFAWGLGTPPLEAVWRVGIELGLGERPPLSKSEFDSLQAALVKYPELGPYIIEGKQDGLFSQNDRGRVEGPYAYLLRLEPSTSSRLTVECEGTKARAAVEVEARTAVASHQGVATRGEPFVWQLPDDGPFPQLVELRFKKARLDDSDKKRRHPVRVSLGAPP
jgi:hypothetical protein